MPIISTLERRTPRGRMGVGAIYLALALGAVTTLYPFLLMVRMTSMDEVDKQSLAPLPVFWWDHDAMARKYLGSQYLEDGQVAWQYNAFGAVKADGTQALRWSQYAQANPERGTHFRDEYFAPLAALPREQVRCRVRDYHAFLAQADPRVLYALFRHVPGRPFTTRWIAYWLAARDGVARKTYQYFERPRPDWLRRDWVPTFDQPWRDWHAWMSWLRPEERMAFSASVPWQMFLRERYQSNLRELNAAHGAAYRSFADGPCFHATPPPADTRARADWEAFVVGRYPLYWQALKPGVAARHDASWRQWLAAERYVQSVEDFRNFTGLAAADAGTMALPDRMPSNEVQARWWCDFVARFVPWDERDLTVSEDLFAAFLQKRYANVAALNAAWGTAYTAWDGVRFPTVEADYLTVTDHAWAIRWELSVGNFRRVLKDLVVEGRAFANTLLLIVLCLFTSLTVNPLAAYALSRFRLRGTHKILIYLLATMALPHEVAMVPSFLLVRDLHLIDSVWALVLPGAANAFSIFLLKGFFDSLPAELYEAATIDGAGEWTLFTRVTLPLSMPIIAVTALGTTMNAYNLFMPAVMYITDQDKWPIATKIYEINQQAGGGGAGMAALVLASIFPLCVFVFFNRIIMRGIVLPSFK